MLRDKFGVYFCRSGLFESSPKVHASLQGLLYITGSTTVRELEADSRHASKSFT